MFPHSPFLRPYSESPFDLVADGVMDLLLEQGLDRFSVSAVARTLRMAPQAMHQRMQRYRIDDTESPAATLYRMTSSAFASRWVDWVGGPLLAARAGAVPVLRLPETEDERLGVAVWLAWHEVARSRELDHDLVPSEILADARAEELQLVSGSLRWVAGRSVADDDVLATLALADGLRAQLVWPGSTVSLDQAREVMARQVAAVVTEVTQPAA